MISVRRFLLVFLGIGLISGCIPDNPNGPFEIYFHHDSDVVVPAEGGTYTFTVEAIKTKAFDWGEILGYIEYKVHIDNTVIYESTRTISRMGYLNEGDTWEVRFDIPKNNTTNSREISVKANEISSEDFWDKSYVIGDDAHWNIVWQGTQLAP
jgi:hypothetical protein